MSFRLVIRRDKQVGYELGLLVGTRGWSTQSIPKHMLPHITPLERLEKAGLIFPAIMQSKAWQLWHHFCWWAVGGSPLGELPFPNKSQKPTKRCHFVSCPSFFFLLGMQREALRFARLRMSSDTGGTWLLCGMVMWLHHLGGLPLSEKLYESNLFFQHFLSSVFKFIVNPHKVIKKWIPSLSQFLDEDVDTWRLWIIYPSYSVSGEAGLWAQEVCCSNLCP